VAHPDLSLTEQRVAQLAAAGRTIREIATQLALRDSTVAWHLDQARRKLERAVALHSRLVDPPR
jgi:DNA-binding CsgD family transcriptional regulator